MAGAVELATAYIALVPSLKGASQKISEELNPAAATSGAAAGDGLGRSIVGTAAKWAAPLAAAVGFGAILKTGFDEAKDAAEGTAQLAAGIASTGNAASVSVDGLNSLASSIQDYSGQTDDSIVKSEQLLLTFTNIKNNGPDKIFDQATKASADMAAKFGGDASQQAVLLGKALNDPVKGISALQRVGVSFTDSQKNTIDAMVKTGDVAGAQKVILGELNTEFGGAAKAAGESFPGQLKRVHRAFEDLSQGIVQGFLPVMGPALEGVITILKKVTPVATDMAQKVADAAARVGAGIKAVFTLLKTGDFTGGIGKALGVEEDSKVVDVILNIRGGFVAMFAAFKAGGHDVTSSGFAGFMERIGLTAREVTGGIHAMFAAYKAGNGDVTSSGFAGFMERVGNGAREVTGGIRAFFAAFKAGGDDVTSSGFAGFLEGLGLKARGVFDSIKSVLSGIDFKGIFGSLFSIIGPLIPQFMGLFSSISPIQTVFKSIEPFLPQLLDVFVQLASVVGGALSTALTTLVPMFIQLQGVFISVFQQVLAAALPVIVQLVTMLGQTFANLLPILMPIITTIMSLAVTLITQLTPIFMQLVSTVLPMVVTIFGAILGAIGPLIQTIAGILIPLIQFLMPVVVMVFSVIAQVIGTVMQIVMGIIQVVMGIISGNWGMVWDGILNIFSGIWNTILAVVGGVLAVLGSIVISGLSGLFGFIGDILGNIGQFFSDTWNNIINGVSGFIGNILGYFQGLPGQIMGALSGAASWLFNVGKDIINGLINGVQSMIGAIGNAILSLVPGPIVGVFKAALGIQSPSRVFRGFGKNIVEGLILGTGDKTDDLSATMRGLVTVPDVPSFGAGSASIAAGAGRGGMTINNTINQVDDPIGTSHAITRRQQMLAV